MRIRESLLAGLLLSTSAIAQTFDVLHVFDNSGENPTAPVLLASDGNLYLPTVGGGTGFGAIYQASPDGSGGFSCALIHVFSGTDGARPGGGLVEGPDGLLYGTTQQGGSDDHGVLYRISTSGDFELLRSLTSSDAAVPFGELVVAPDGNFYGTSSVGGAGGNGSIFRFDPSNNEFESVYFFGDLTGANPQSGLLVASDGKLYGTTPNGGGESYGTIFRIDTVGTFELLHSFSASGGNRPYGVLADLGGSTYGIAHGAFNYGAIFRWNATSGFANVHTFSGLDGSSPTGGLVANGGFLYGTTQSGGAASAGTLFQSDANGNVTVLHEFDYLDGAQPSAHPTRIPAAWVGTTQTAGAGFSGTVYRLPDGGALATDCAFGQSEGYTVSGPLFEASDGNLYAATRYGGLYYDQGTLFRLGKDGQVSTIHSFNLLDGRYPTGGLVQGFDGALFGVTVFGGANNEGAAYGVDLAGSFSLLHSFTYDATGDYPTSLSLGPDSELYGSTSGGGSCGSGVLYRMAVNGAIANLYDTCAAASGPLLSASDGFMYGVGAGTLVFRLSINGDFETIASSGFPVTGIVQGLAEGPDPNFYGTAGNGFSGVLFRLLKDGRTSNLHSFSPVLGGFIYTTSLIRGSDGRLYGASYSGTGGGDPGTVFRTNVYGDFEVLHTFDVNDPQSLSSLIEASDGKLYGLATRSAPYGRGLAYRIDLGAQLNGISPSSGPSYDPAPVEIAGSGFQEGAVVAVGGTSASDVVVTSGSHATAMIPILFPGTLNDVVITNPDTTFGRLTNGWMADFEDVPASDPFHSYVEKVFRSHVAAGYGSGLFGRDDPVTRAQMAVFLLKGGLGPGLVPNSCSGHFFDVPCPSLFADWIEELQDRQITGGCQQAPHLYCPEANVTRAQIAVFILKTLHGGSFSPPACAGIFEDVACPGGFAVDWIEDLYNSGVTAGCSTNPLRYCPDGPVSRGQTAVLIVRAFGLP